MHIIVLVLAILGWIFIQAHMRDQGIEPRSRGSLRYQRRKARKLGLDPADVQVRPRRASTSSNSVSAGDIGRSLLITVFLLALLIGGEITIMAAGLGGGVGLLWLIAVPLVSMIIRHR